MQKITQLLISIDVEPDERMLRVDGTEPWRGHEYLIERAEKIRRAFQKRTKRPANFVWCLRLDPQIEKSFGATTWPLRKFDASIALFARAGDRFGIHPHPFRWDDANHNWREEFGDQSWVEQCVRLSLEAYESYFGDACKIFRFGDGWINDETLDLVSRLGLAFDLTLEPGITDSKGWGGRDIIYPKKSHAGGVQIMPYRRLGAGNERADKVDQNGLWMVPVSTASLSANSDGTPTSEIEQPEMDPRLSLRKCLLETPQNLIEMIGLRSLLKRCGWSRTAYERLAQLYIDLMSVRKNRTGMQALNMALDPEYYAYIFDHALSASRQSFIHTVVRSGDLAFRYQRANFNSNIKFLLNHRNAETFAVSTPDRLSQDWEC